MDRAIYIKDVEVRDCFMHMANAIFNALEKNPQMALFKVIEINRSVVAEEMMKQLKQQLADAGKNKMRRELHEEAIKTLSNFCPS